MSNLELYNRIFVKVFKTDENRLNDLFTFALTDEWDSIAHMLLIGEIEDAFDILLEAEDILRYGSYENGKRILERYGVSFG